MPNESMPVGIYNSSRIFLIQEEHDGDGFKVELLMNVNDIDEYCVGILGAEATMLIDCKNPMAARAFSDNEGRSQIHLVGG